jgi:hypothetical protein
MEVCYDMKAKSFMLMLSIAWLLTGCGAAVGSTIEGATAEETEAAEGESGYKQEQQGQEQDQESGRLWLDEVAAATIDDVPTALAAMNGIVKTMKQTVESDTAAEVPIAEVEAQTDELAALWLAIEPEVRAAHDAHATELEAGIIALAQAIREQPIDRQRIIEADYRIYQALRDVSALFE